MAEDGKVVFKYEGDTSGIDTANEEALEKIKSAGAQADDATKSAGKKIAGDAKTTGDEVVAGVNTASAEVDKAYGSGAATLGQRITSKLGLTASSIKTALGAVGVGIAGFLADTVESAAAAQKATDTLTNLLQNQGMSAKSAGKDITDFKKTIMDMSSFSGGEARDALTVLTQKGLDVGDALKAAGTLANVAAGNNMDLASAADVVADAYNGKTRALVTLGILSKDEVKQLGNSESATITMADVQDRLNKRFGGAAKTDLESYSGQVKENTNLWNAAKTQIGGAVLPVLSQLLEGLSKIITPIADFIEKHPKVAAAILGVVAVLGILIGGMSLATTVMGFFAVASTAVIWPILIVIAAVAALIAITALIVTYWKPISGFFVDLWKTISNAFVNAWHGIEKFFNDMWSWMTGFFKKWYPEILGVLLPFLLIPLLIFQHWSQISAFLSQLWADITSGLTTAWNAIVGFFQGIWTWAVGFFTQWGPLILAVLVPFIGIPLLIWQHFAQIKDWLSGLWNDVIGGIKGFVTDVGNDIAGIGDIIIHAFDTAISFITDLPAKMLQWGKDMIQNLIDGIKSGIGAIGDAVKGVADKISSFLHFSVPDEGPLKEFPSWPKDMMQTWGDELSGNDDYVVTALKKVTTKVAGTLQVDPSTTGSVTAAISNSLSSAAGLRAGNTTIVVQPAAVSLYADKTKLASTVTNAQYSDKMTRRI